MDREREEEGKKKGGGGKLREKQRETKGEIVSKRRNQNEKKEIAT